MAKKDNNIRTAFFLNLAFTVLEVTGGLISGSIAILADSLHDFADSLSLGAGWYFEKKSRKGSTDKYSYGYARFSLLGAMINALTLLLGSIYIVYASVERIINPQNPDAYWMLGISFLGIALNGIGVWKLKSGKSMNKQVMMIHLLEDALGWVAVLVGSIVMLLFDVPILDPILAIVINLTVLVFAMHKLVQALKILLQKVPKNINLPELRQKILCLDKVKDVEHLHIWSLTEEKAVVTAHVIVSDIRLLSDSSAIKEQIHAILSDIDTEHINIDLKSSD
ncbi:cation diffusion facilitator family transporter [Algoriphagus sp. AGSA1]|uniref:cation diffusion facilitator family transporter n=1 Tax=Algoriphagus sp. AGSA1 TaxID=2907213 RepID=UPI001F326E4B|nr:cation diffusion facilitator family transporter [Algoriphagus sp. AGSA1]